jgi:hypothetical protein
MNFEETLPLRFWINLGRRGDRRAETEVRLDEAGVTAERFSAIDASGIPVSATTARMVQETGPDGMIRWQITKSPRGEVRGYEGAGRYALALTQRLALREARRRGAPAVLLLEDDVVFHPNFQALVSAVDLPDDWGIFYLGCTHNRRPSWAGTRVVRCDYAVDTHAIAVRAPYYGRVMEMLDRHLKPDLGVAKASDQFLALLHQEIPSYACYPNLAWQDVSASDLTNHVYSNYTKDGRQKNWQESVVTLLPEITNPPSSSKEETIRTSAKNQGFPRTTCSSRETRLGLLFLTRGDVNNPEIWREFVAEMPDRVEIFSHPKHPKELIGGFLEGTAIQKLIPTQWGDISLVRAAREMLLAALEDPSLTHFALLSESCVPIKPLPEIIRRLQVDPRPQFGFKTLSEVSSRKATRIDAVPEVPAGCWRFTSQWWLLDRASAIFAAGQDYTPLFAKMDVPDEGYFATVMAMQGYPLDGEVLNKDSTWTWWENDAGSPNSWEKIPKDRLERMLHSGAIFARKFPKRADIGDYALHRSVAPEPALRNIRTSACKPGQRTTG